MNEKKPRVISSLGEFLEWAEQFDRGQYLFRGLPKESWEIIPSTYLRLNENRRNIGMLIKLNEELLEDARRLGYDSRDGEILSDLELLADLQHRGSATCLIDFTRSAFVALWFACQTSSEGVADGRVFAVRFKDPAIFETVTSLQSAKGKLEEFFKSDGGSESLLSHARQAHPSDSSSDVRRFESSPDRKSTLHQWQPKPVNHSIIAQKSNFVFGNARILAEKECVIRQSSKSKILESLEKSSGINEETIFPGLDNFARRHSYDRPYNEPDAQDYLRRGTDALMESNLDAAIRDYTNAVELDPNNAPAYSNRGIAYAKKGDLDNAIRDFSKAIEIDPNDAKAYGHRGNAYSHKGVLGKAIEDCSKAIELNPNDATVYHVRGVVYAKKDKFDKAIRDFDKAIELDPNEAAAYSNRGTAYYHKDDFDAAIADFRKAIELDPNKATAYINRGRAYAKKDEFDAAIADCSKAIELNPKYAAAYSNRSAAYFKNDDFDAAIADCSKAIELNPEYTLAYRNRGLAHAKKGDPDAAIRDYTKAIELDPENAVGYRLRSIAYAEKGEHEKARQDREKAEALGLDSGGES